MCTYPIKVPSAAYILQTKVELQLRIWLGKGSTEVQRMHGCEFVGEVIVSPDRPHTMGSVVVSTNP